MTVNVRQSPDGTYRINDITGITLEDILVTPQQNKDGNQPPNFAKMYGFNKKDIQTIILAITKIDAINTINTFHADLLKQLTGNATIEERDTWERKAIASERYKAKTASIAEQRMLEIEAHLTGEDINKLVDKILARVEQYEILIGTASGLKRKTIKSVEQSTNPKDIQVILQTSQQDAQNYIKELHNNG